MWIPLLIAVSGGCLALGAWATWRAVTDRPVILRQLFLAGGIEALLLVQAVVAGVQAAGGGMPGDAVTFWGYLVTSMVVLPIAGLWAFAERSRWSSVVMLVAALTVAFLQYRTLQVWNGL